MNLLGSAHLISGSSEALPVLLKYLEGQGLETKANPDLYVREYSRFGIDEAIDIRSRASSRAIAGKGRIFIVVCSSMTAEAQDALLKTLEEPSADAMFFFIVPSPETLLGTLRSRMQRLSFSDDRRRGYSGASTSEYAGAAPDFGKIDADKFVASSPEKRILMLKPLLDRDENDERDLGAIISFLSSLERNQSKKNLSESKDGLKAIYRAQKYIADKGALLKPLLEQVALLIPVV